MATVAAGEEFCQFIRVFSSDLKNLPLVRGIGDFFASLFNHRSNLQHCERGSGLSSSIIENLVVPAEDSYDVDVQNLFRKQKGHNNYEDEHDPCVVFNVLDMVLAETMERLKKLREGFSIFGRCSLQDGLASVLHNKFKLASDGTCATIRSLCFEGKVQAAMDLYDKLLGNHTILDICTYNCLMNGLCKTGDLLSATCLLEKMAGVGVTPNSVTYNTLVDGYCRFGNMDKALDLVSSMPQIGVNPNIVTCNILVHALCVKGLNVEKFLGEILEEHQNTYNAITSTILMDGYMKKGNVFEALQIWKDMFEKGIRIDRIAYNVLINGLCLVRDMKVAYMYCSDMFKRGFYPDIATFNTLISGCSRKAFVDDACDIFNKIELSGLQPDNISYKLVIQSLCRQGNIYEAVNLLYKMLDNKLVPDLSIWNPIINGYGRFGDIYAACSIKDMMVAVGVSPNVYTYNALINAYIKAGKMKQAMLLKKEMLVNGTFPDAVTYNILIAGAFNSGYISHPFVPKMWNAYFQPNIFTYTELIRGLCKKKRMEEARLIFDKLLKSGLPLDHVPFQILIKSYCKRGKLVEALNIYEKMMRKGLVGHFSMYRSLFIALRRSGYYMDASHMQ